MKKLSLLFAVIIAAALPFITSCGTDEAVDPPTIMLNAATGYTATDVSLPVNSTFKVGVIAQKGSASLKNIKISATMNTVTDVLVDSTFTGDSYNRDFTITAPSSVGSVRFTFAVTDANGETAQAQLTVTTTASPINSYVAVLLGGQENATLGSFYSTADNTVMNIATARSTPKKADMVYYYGTTNKASIVAPADAQLSDVPAFEGVTTWTTRNATKFKLTTGITWANVTDESAILANVTNLTLTHVNDLKVGDIVAFETASTSTNASKKGLYKVLEINGTTGADRAIKIEVKIQK